MKKLRWLFLIFAIAGLGLIVGGVYVVRSTRRFVARADQAAGVVIENVWRESSSSRGRSGAYYPRIRFRTRAGRDLEFLSSSGASPASYREGEGVEVLYDPADPSNASINSFWSLWLGAVLLLGLGVIFSSIGVIPLALMRRKRILGEWLRANGQRIQSAFERVELDHSITVNGSHPYRIVSQWLNPLTNQVHVFHSGSIWYDPEKYISGTEIGVWIDPQNPKRYVMETSFLPRSAD